MRLQYRLILIFTGLMAAIILGLNLVMYSMSSGYREHSFFLSLEDNSRLIANAVVQEDNAAHYYEVKNNVLQYLPNEEEYIFKFNKKSKDIKYPEHLPLPQEFYEEAIQKGKARLFDDGVYYVALYIQGKDGIEDILAISLARDVEGDQYRSRLKNTLISAFLIGMTLMGLTTVVFSRRLFGPMVQIIKKVNSINALNLNTRLEKEHSVNEIEDLKDTLNDMLNRIEGSFKAQHDFIGNTSHSLRTPLTIIAGEAEIALQQMKTGQDNSYSVNLIMQEAEKLNHLINILLEVAKTGMYRQNMYLEKIRIDELLNSVNRVVKKMDKRYKLKLDYGELPDNSNKLYLECNTHLLALAINNIILNSFKYSGNDEVKMKLTCQENELIIQIIDNGIGIPKSELNKIFNPYFRASNTDGYEGFGIGLALSMDIISVHKGAIAVDSTEGVGTVVTITLPNIYATEPV
jgi:signal transduction histidine kinase